MVKTQTEFQLKNSLFDSSTYLIQQYYSVTNKCTV